MAKHRALGKGLGALIPTSQENIGKEVTKISENTQKSTTLPVKCLIPNPGQPRKEIDQKGLEVLAESLKIHGVVQPLVVREHDSKYEIIAGERRWRAAQMADIDEVPVVYFSGSDQEAMEVSLIENIQREDLTPLEVAGAMQDLMQNYSMTQEDVSQKLGWSRSAVANKLRLLKLPEEVKFLMEKGLLSEGHARALLSFDSDADKVALARESVYKMWSVRQLEKIIQDRKTYSTMNPKKEYPVRTDPFEEIIGSIRERFNFNLKVTGSGKNMKLSLSGLQGGQIEKILNLLENEGEEIFPGK